MNKKLLNGFIVVAFTLFLPCAIIAGISTWGYAMAFAEPEQIEINLNVPMEAEVGKPFIMELYIKNLASKSQSLESVDISSDLLEGIEIQQSEPIFKESTPGQGYHSYVYDIYIPPGDSLVVEVYAIGIKIGEYPGFIDICINQPNSWMRFDGTIVVK